jgi:hypothetical protein
MRHFLGKEYAIGEIHSLMSEEAVIKYIEGLMEIREFILFSYYAKRMVNKDPLTIIPPKLLEVSDLLVWMDLYTMDWKVIKDAQNESGPLLARWKANINRMSG